MCFDGKCCCLEVETGTLVWAIITTGFTGLATLCCASLFIYTTIMMVNVGRTDSQLSFVLAGASNIIIVIAMSIALLSFVFSLFLLMGVIKKKPGYVKAYFVYGIVRTVLSLLIIIIILVAASDGELNIILPVSFITFITYGIYGLILHMVRMTYVKFCDGNIIHQYSHKLLVE